MRRRSSRSDTFSRGISSQRYQVTVGSSGMMLPFLSANADGRMLTTLMAVTDANTKLHAHSELRAGDVMTPEDQTVTRPGAARLVQRALLLRCPSCGRGRVLLSWLR